MAVLMSTDKDFASMLDSNDKVIVKFTAKWCGSCKLFAPKFKRVSNNEQFSDIVFIDIDAEENEEARKLAGVDNLPFLATFKGGNLVEGTPSSKEEKLVNLLENLNTK